MDDFFVQERKYYLSQFLLKLTEHPIICRTPEVQVFVRPQQKTVEASFKALKPTSTDYVLQYYQRNINITKLDVNESYLTKYNADIIEF